MFTEEVIDMADKRPVGRPTKYKDEYCELVIKFFTREPFEVIYVEDDDGKKTVATNKQGDPILKPCALPTKEAFATHIGVHTDTLLNWAKEHPEFFGAIKRAENIQKDILIQNGLIGSYDKTFAIFVAKNVTDMRDQKAIEHSGSVNSVTYDIKTDNPKEAAQEYMELIKNV